MMPQLSVAFNPPNKTLLRLAPHCTGSLLTMISGNGAGIIGGVRSFAVTRIVQNTEFPLPSEAVTWKLKFWSCTALIAVPAAGLCVNVTVPQLSVPINPVIISGTMIWQLEFKERLRSAGHVCT